MQLIMYFESNNNNNIQTLLERGFYSFNISYITNNIQSLIEHKHNTLRQTKNRNKIKNLRN